MDSCLNYTSIINKADFSRIFQASVKKVMRKEIFYFYHKNYPHYALPKFYIIIKPKNIFNAY
jgi:hypothetical protein